MAGSLVENSVDRKVEEMAGMLVGVKVFVKVVLLAAMLVLEPVASMADLSVLHEDGKWAGKMDFDWVMLMALGMVDLLDQWMAAWSVLKWVVEKASKMVVWKVELMADWLVVN